LRFSLKTTLAIGVICIKYFTKLSKTFLNYAPNVFVQPKNYKHGDGAFFEDVSTTRQLQTL